MITITVASGETLSGIAEQYGTTYQAIAARNGISDPNVISVGETLIIPSGGSWAPAPSSASASTSTSPSASSTGGGGTGYHIPGVSDAVAACIAFHESSDGATSWNIFQVTGGSGYTVTPGMSLAQQEQVAGEVAANQGVQSAWGKYDGC